MEEANNVIVGYLMSQGVIAYQRGLARAVHDHTAGLLLSQFWYWAERLPDSRDGWFFMTQEQIYEETMISRREQETARRKLRELGVLEEERRGAPAKLWFRINADAVIALLEKQLQSQNGGKRHSSMAENAILEWRKTPNKNGAFRHSSIKKTTSKITSKTTAAAIRDPAPTPPAPAGDPPDSAAAALVEELIAQEINHADAIRLAAQKPDECRKQLAYLPHKIDEIGGEANFKSGKGAYLRSAIESGFAAPAGYKTVRERQTREERQRKTQEQKQARDAHRERFLDAYRHYLRESESRLALSHPEEYRAFHEKTRQVRERLATMRTTGPVERFDREEAHLERLREHFSALPDTPLLDFWAWDQQLNEARLEAA